MPVSSCTTFSNYLCRVCLLGLAFRQYLFRQLFMVFNMSFSVALGIIVSLLVIS